MYLEREQVRIEEIQMALSGIKNIRAPGPAAIFIELINNALMVVWEANFGIFTSFLHSGEVLKEKRVEDVSSINKKG